MSRIVFVTVPRYTPSPHFGLQILANYLDSVETEFYDANLDLYTTHVHTEHWTELETIGIQQLPRTKVSPIVWEIIAGKCQRWADAILKLNPDYVGISVFTHESRNWTQWLCYYIRKTNSSVKIILGGKGLNDPGVTTAIFGQQCLEWQLCDYFFNGEAEHELPKFLAGLPSNVNQSTNFAVNSALDYTRTIFTDANPYKFTSNWYSGQDRFDNTHPVIETDSQSYKTFSNRGCVKRCTFCDVHLMRNKLSSRSPENLFNELQTAIDNGHRKISFTDDMINSNNKQFMSWMELLANYLARKNINDFVWSSPFGIKAQVSMPNRMFDLLEVTGAHLMIGVDHFSDSVLEHMKKMYTQDDILSFFERAKNKNIKYEMLMFVCSYPTETTQDFETLKHGIRTLSQYRNQVNVWEFGSTCNIPVGSELATMPGMRPGSNQNNWIYDYNPELTTQEKLRRRKELDILAQELDLVVRKQRTQWLRIQSWT